MTDRELLELAAKAAGIELPHPAARTTEWRGAAVKTWNPLDDDGDALRLAVKLEMMVDPVNRVVAGYFSDICVEVDFDEQVYDPYAATRRAIVRAAAEIGKGMK